MINLEKIKKDPLIFLPKYFLDSKRVLIAKKSIKEELKILKDYSTRKYSYNDLSKKYGFSIKIIYRILKTWGKTYPPNLEKVVRFKRKKSLSILNDLMICDFYLVGNSIYVTARKFNLSPKGVEGILKRYGFKLRSCLESSNLRYNKKTLKYPLSTYVPKFLKRKFKKYFPDLIAILTLTDGCCTPSGKLALKVRRPKLIYYGAPTLCKIYIDLVKYYYGIDPSVFNKRKDGTYNVIYERKEIKDKLLPHLLSYSPSYKTSPAKGQSKSSYLNEKQPSLEFLGKKPRTVLVEVLRLGMSTEGSCNIHINGKRIDPNLRLACSHPILIKQWKYITDKLGFSFKIRENKEHWSGIDCIATMRLKDLRKFLDIGGFIEEVKVTNNSRYYKGLDKNLIVKGILEWNKQKKYLNRYKKPSQVHNIFRKFIKEEVS